jgi:hypothetical protein
MAVSSDVSIVLCTLTAFLYVSSLYIGTFLFGARKGGSRDSPAVVRRRFAGVTVACALALLIVHTARQAGQVYYATYAREYVSKDCFVAGKYHI